MSSSVSSAPTVGPIEPLMCHAGRPGMPLYEPGKPALPSCALPHVGNPIAVSPVGVVVPAMSVVLAVNLIR